MWNIPWFHDTNTNSAPALAGFCVAGTQKIFGGLFVSKIETSIANVGIYLFL